MKRIIVLLILALTLCSCSGERDIIELSEPFYEKPMLSVDNEYLLSATDIDKIIDEYIGVTLKCDGIEYEVLESDGELIVDDGETLHEGSDARALIDSLLPRVFEKDTSLQLETNLLDDGTGEAVVYLFVDEQVKKAFPSEELETDSVFSVYYELDENGRAVSVTYSKAVDRENFKILQTVTFTY